METFRSEYIQHYDRYLSDLMKDETAAAYMHRAYDYLEMMGDDKVMHLQDDNPKQLQWLLVACGAFLAAGDHWIDYELNDDYTKVRKKFVPPNFRKKLLLQIQEKS